MSPKEINAAISGGTSIEQEQRKRAYLGKLILVGGKVRDVSKFSSLWHVEYWISLPDEDDIDIRATCNRLWGRDILGISIGDRVTIRGRIVDPSRYYFTIRAIRRPRILRKTSD